jgi:hypothetical protein
MAILRIKDQLSIIEKVKQNIMEGNLVWASIIENLRNILSLKAEAEAIVKSIIKQLKEMLSLG